MSGLETAAGLSENEEASIAWSQSVQRDQAAPDSPTTPSLTPEVEAELSSLAWHRSAERYSKQVKKQKKE